MMNNEEEMLIRSGLVQNFVKQKGGQWNHKDWLGFLASVRSAGYHSLSDDQIGRILEQEKVKKVEKQQTAKSDKWQVGDREQNFGSPKVEMDHKGNKFPKGSR